LLRGIKAELDEGDDSKARKQCCELSQTPQLLRVLILGIPTVGDKSNSGFTQMQT
jgi:hypothetical protein